MKNLLLASVVLLLTTFVFSSCSTSCNGNWYNNRNVNYSPTELHDNMELATSEAFLENNLVRN